MVPLITKLKAAPRLRGVLMPDAEGVPVGLRGVMIPWHRLLPLGSAWLLLDENGRAALDGKRRIYLRVAETHPNHGPRAMWARAMRQAVRRREARIVIPSASRLLPIVILALPGGMLIWFLVMGMFGDGRRNFAEAWSVDPVVMAILLGFIALMVLGFYMPCLGMLRSVDRELRLDADGWCITDSRGGTSRRECNAVRSSSLGLGVWVITFADGPSARIRPGDSAHGTRFATFLNALVGAVNADAKRPPPSRLRAVVRVLVIGAVLFTLFAFCLWRLAGEIPPEERLRIMVAVPIAIVGVPLVLPAYLWLVFRLLSPLLTAEAKKFRRTRARPPIPVRHTTLAEMYRAMFRGDEAALSLRRG